MKKWTIIGLGFLALFAVLCLASKVMLGIALIIAIVGFATAAYLIGARRVKSSFLGFLARYGTIFLALALIGGILELFLTGFFTEIRSLTATLVGGILSLGGVEYSLSGPIIMVQNPSFASDITVGCLGGTLFCIYIALVVAAPRATWRQRLTGIGAGLAILLGFNIFRITSSVYLGWLTGVNVHDYFYVFNMVFVLLVWAGWIRTLKPRAETLANAMA